MNRRESFKSIVLGAIAGSTVITAVSCGSDEKKQPILELPAYGRTPAEKEHDAKVLAETFFKEHEMATIHVLCDIILPATPTAASAVEAKVPEFIEFIVKDLPTYHALPLQGGLMWLDSESNRRFDKIFIDASEKQRIEIVEDIAYPDPEGKKINMAHGIQFFDKMRYLVLTGYYTSKEGIKDLNYKGNMPNVWDGVPDDVLKEHGMAYDKDWLPKFVDQSKRDVIAVWDDEGNLIS
jgi:hypothetical protein